MGFWDGTATDWGTAVGTVGLAAAGVVSLLREAAARRELRDERDSERARAERLQREKDASSVAALEEQARRERQAYADGVSCYIDTVGYDADTVVLSPGDAGVPNAGALMQCAVVRNLGRSPIRNVEVHWQDARSGRVEADLAIAGTPVGLLAVVPPTGLRAIRRPDSLGSDWTRTMLAVLVKFDDFNGVRWARLDDGRLYEVTGAGALSEAYRKHLSTPEAPGAGETLCVEKTRGPPCGAEPGLRSPARRVSGLLSAPGLRGASLRPCVWQLHNWLLSRSSAACLRE